ncbi:hypothetical protein Glove_86g216 [Diversispora epigaea]|uniref:Protein kinase domain-containing protein n=1 Tax=Diversispora epigaea TaxID=1348612 RepID=A0A397JAW1_9GLOM|nr:hypothetical protein Glove_86g216 [Diversispora epigaea]
MSREIEKIMYCPAGHSSEDFSCSGHQNFIRFDGICSLCSNEHYIQEFKTWSSGNADIDKIIQESQINNIINRLHWIPYDNFQNIEHIADGGHGSVYSTKLDNGIKLNWNFIKQDWKYYLIGCIVALKEIKDSRFDMVEFLKVMKTVNEHEYEYIAKYYGISKNPSTQNYIIVMDLFDDGLHNFLTKKFWDLGWPSKIDILTSIAYCLSSSHEKNLVHCDLHSGNILINYNFDPDLDLGIDLGLCKLENDLILNSNNKNNKISGSIPYTRVHCIPPEVLRGNEFTREGNIYSFGGIMYEMVTAQRKKFWDLGWPSKIDILTSIAYCLSSSHEKNLVHCDLHSGNILINYNFDPDLDLGIDLGLCKLENDLILNSNNKNNKISGSIPYTRVHCIPPEVLRGNEFTREGNIYSFGGIMYEMVTAQRPFADQAHDTYLMIDICNGVRPKVPDFMLNWIPEWYLKLIYQCWNDDPSERPTSTELSDLFLEIYEKQLYNEVDNNVMRQLEIADENQKNTSKSQKQELFELFSHSSKLHPQSCYISRYIHTLHGLHDLLEEIKSGKSSDPNLLKPNESTILRSNSYDFYSKELLKPIDKE